MKNVQGRWGMPCGHFPFVKVTTPLELPECPQCGNVVLPGDVFDAVDAALQTSTLTLVKNDLDFLKTEMGLNYKFIARILGITPEYLSMVLNGKKNPSFGLVQMLRMYRNHPEAIGEAEKFWKIARTA